MFQLYVRDTAAAWDLAQLTQLLAYCDAWWAAGKNGGAALASLVSTSWALERTETQDLDVVNGLIVQNVVLRPGTRAGIPITPTVACLVTLHGDPGAFPKQGRVFFPGANEGDIDGQEYVGSYFNAVATAFNDFRTDLNDITSGGDVNWAQVIVSRHSGTVVDPSPPKVAVRRATAVTNTLGPITTRQLIAVQKRRRGVAG